MANCYTDDMVNPFFGKQNGVDNNLYSALPHRSIGAMAAMV
jgi:hypothetical protein